VIGLMPMRTLMIAFYSMSPAITASGIGLVPP
jgi:hypothetical protein